MVENKVNNAEDKDIKRCTEESEAEKIEDKEVAELIAKVSMCLRYAKKGICVCV